MKRTSYGFICTFLLCATFAQAVGIAAYYTASFPMLEYELYDRNEIRNFDSPGWLGISVKGWHMISPKIGIEGYATYTSGYHEGTGLNWTDYRLKRVAAGAGVIYSITGGGFSLTNVYAEIGPTVQWTEFELNRHYSERLEYYGSYNYGMFIGVGVSGRLSQHFYIDFNPHYTAIFNPNSHEDENVEHLDFFDLRLGMAVEL